MEEVEEATIERISQLRQAVQELRAEIQRERLSIQRQQQQQRGHAYCRGTSPTNKTNKTNKTKGEEGSPEQRRRDEDPEALELEATELANFYKVKIDEIESECCAELARIRESFEEPQGVLPQPDP